MTVQLMQEKDDQKKSRITPATIARRIGSIRMSYRLVIEVVSWLALVLFIHLLQVVGIIEGR